MNRTELAMAALLAPVTVKRRLLYAVGHRRMPNLRVPRRFTEKVNWQILHDRRPLLAFTCDKLRVKEEAARAGIAAPRTLWSGIDIREAEGVRLPEHWVLKPNHRTHLVHFGHRTITDGAELAQLTRGWLHDYHGENLGEWAYTQARPLLIIEDMLMTGQTAPPDFRLFTFDGIVLCVQVDHDMHGTRTRRFYTPQWEPLGVQLLYPLAEPIPAPAGLDAMVDAARTLGERFDLIRIDFYDLRGADHLGEMTPYPSGGVKPFHRASFDFELGDPWTLPTLP